MGKNSTVIYHDYPKRFKNLSRSQFGDLIVYALLYDETGEVPDIQDIEVRVAFGVVQYDIDTNRSNYESVCTRNRENGKKGGRPATRETQSNPQEPTKPRVTHRNPENPQKPDSERDRDSERDSEGAKAPQDAPAREGDIFTGRSFSLPMRDKLTEWLKYKAERRESYKPTGLKSFLTEVENKLKTHSEADIIALIGECMASGYRGVIWDKLKARASPQKTIDEKYTNWG